MLTYLAEHPDIANAVAAVANTVIAFVALLVATLSIVLSWRALRHQVHHAKLSARPIPFLALANFQDCLRVRILNEGIGPMIVKRVTFSDGVRTEKDVISWMPVPPLGLLWTNYKSRFEDRSILPGAELTLLELQGDLTDETFTGFRDKCRTVLQRLEGTIEYTDIYGDAFPPYSRKMDWFQVK